MKKIYKRKDCEGGRRDSSKKKNKKNILLEGTPVRRRRDKRPKCRPDGQKSGSSEENVSDVSCLRE